MVSCVAFVAKSCAHSGGMGAYNIVDNTDGVAVWSNQWFSWMGEAKADRRSYVIA